MSSVFYCLNWRIQLQKQHTITGKNTNNYKIDATAQLTHSKTGWNWWSNCLIRAENINDSTTYEYLLKVRVTTIWFICVYIHFTCSSNNVTQKSRILLITLQDKIMKRLVIPLLITLLFLGFVFTDVSAGRDMPNDKVYRYGRSHMGLARRHPCDLLSQVSFSV